ncbi:hypothetical protein PAECIP111893_02980 [Paenibacillus plantiphilus]|uniref:Uncharacterized protein n=1 Tax=Paenibacillus plantiphilus TaxID=2905650 RepID=A0ABM9CD68_9BACL|nr:hypothetical protein [Paenibacillus plantiphilus]CAH1209099.1 hypothetical protein PAECIP111893_02980 [Paenibacillus plantiphilus]
MVQKRGLHGNREGAAGAQGTITTIGNAATTAIKVQRMAKNHCMGFGDSVHLADFSRNLSIYWLIIQFVVVYAES